LNYSPIITEDGYYLDTENSYEILTDDSVDPSIFIGTQLYSTDPAFVNGSTITNFASGMISVSTPYLGSNPNFTLSYTTNILIMSNPAQTTNASAIVTFSQVPIMVAGT
jgi:hypothetical protein